MPLRIVTTGSRGFIGSVFSLRAVERGHTVLALDDESRGENPIEQKIGGSYHKHDCKTGFHDLVSELAPRTRVDVVAHFAAATGSLDRPLEELLELNVEMTKHVYEDALRLGARCFLWPTTSLALGVPDSPYVESKERALAMLKTVDAKAKISTPLRFFNVAGAYKDLSELRKNEVHLIPEIVRAAAQRFELIINGDDYDTIDGTPSRDFVHVFDVVEYLLDIAEAQIAGAKIAVPHPDDGAIWLGKGVSTTVREAIDIYQTATGNTVPIQIGPRRPFDCGSLQVDIRQAAQFAMIRGGLAPAWVSIRDEAAALAGRHRAWRGETVSGEIDTQAALASSY